MKPNRICLLVVCLCAAVFQQAAVAQQEGREPDDPSGRSQYLEELRRYPYAEIPAGARVKALNELRVLERSAKRKGIAADALQWQLIGPRPTTSTNPLYVTAGRIGAIAVDPRDNNVVYLGAASGGIWKTTDGGKNWLPLTDDQLSLATGAIAIDPSNPDIIYAGTGEATFSVSSYYGAGILKSTDGGATWQNFPGPWTRARFGGLAVHPKDSKILMAAVSPGGIYRSEDAGETWTVALGPTATISGTGVLFDPSDPSIVWAALGSTGGSTNNGIYRSTDGGKTFQRRSGAVGTVTGLPASNVGRIALTISRSNPSVLYAAIQDSGTTNNGNLLGVYKTTDAGETWRRVNATNVCNTQCWYNLVISVHPTNPDVVIWGGLNLQRSLDGGETFRTLTTGPNGQDIHVDHHVLTYTPDGSRLFFGNDGGVWFTDDATQAVLNFNNLNSTLAITQFYGGISIDESNPNAGLGGTQDNGTQRFGGEPGWRNITCGDGGWTAIDPTVPDFAYGTCQNIDIRRTRTLASGGFTQSIYGINANDRVAFIPPFVIDPTKPNRLYFGTHRLWRTDDATGSWTAISPDLAPTTGTIRSIGIAPSDPKTIYVGTSNGRISVTRNAGADWRNASNGIPNRIVTQIEVDPIDPLVAYATVSGFDTGHLFKTVDGGNNWGDISGNLPNVPVMDVVVDPDVPDTLYLATDVGVLVSGDGGFNWTTLGNGLPRVVTFSLALNRRTRVLRAATHGRSIWEVQLPSPGSSVRPFITSIDPAQTATGGKDLTLTIKGSGFGSGVQVLFNGEARPVVSATSTELKVTIPASDLATSGRAAIAVFQPSRGAGLSNSMLFSIGGAPVFSSSSISSAATPLTRYAPGSIAVMYGVDLAPSLIEYSAVPLPRSLGETSVLINGATTPLYYVSPTQVSFQIPWTLTTNAVANVQVISDVRQSSTAQIRIDQFAPALFSVNRQGNGQGAIRIANSAIIPGPTGSLEGARPARTGEVVELYATGLGAVTNQPATGAPASSTVLSRTLTEVTATVGGVNAAVRFSGLAPGSVGLYQVNIDITAQMPRGNAVPVEISIGGQKSNPVTMAIQ
jgi:uncharacterized protein (TIGR03437 family)